jgi:hypothetical protein
MTMITYDEFTQIQKQLEGCYRTAMSQVQLDAYWAVWKLFPLPILSEALSQWMAGEDGKYFPAAPVIVPLADRVWQSVVRREATQQRLDEHQAADRLLTGPVAAWGDPGSLPRAAVQLVRDLCTPGGLVAGSPEHHARQAEIERLAGASVGRPHVAGREGRAEVIAKYHAQGDAKLEPCSAACTHAGG